MLKDKLIEYNEKGRLAGLSNATGVPLTTLKDILRGAWKKYQMNTLNILYDYLGLEKDDFYKNNMKQWFPKTQSLFGTFVRGRRIEMGLSLDYIAKQARMDTRCLARLESGDSLPDIDSWTITHIQNILKFSQEERQMTSKYILIMKELEGKVKKLYK